MGVLHVGLLLLVVVIVALAAFDRARVDTDRAAEREQWAIERSELLTRIQRPELLRLRPRSTDTEPAVFEPPADLVEYRKVGAVMPLKEA